MRVEKEFDLSSRNTFRMKVKCAAYVEYESVKELEQIDFDSLPKPFLHIGSGSNLLFTKDFSGTVFHSKINYIKYIDMGLDDVPVVVGAGVVFDDFVAQTCGHGLWGAENLSLIPGEVGAAAVQNIGAYGTEVKDIISGVVCFDIQEKKGKKFKVEECGYGYRDSFFKNAGGRYFITSVLFRLSRKPIPKIEYKGLKEQLGDAQNVNPQTIREAVISIRNSKLPDPKELGSAGSFFKNPVVDAISFAKIIDKAKALKGPDCTVPHYLLNGGFVKIPAAWLIEQCGFKGRESGGAAVYEKQPLVLVNKSGTASPEDVLSLENEIIKGVKETFQVELHPEVEHI